VLDGELEGGFTVVDEGGAIQEKVDVGSVTLMHEVLVFFIVSTVRFLQPISLDRLEQWPGLRSFQHGELAFQRHGVLEDSARDVLIFNLTESLWSSRSSKFDLSSTVLMFDPRSAG